MCIAGVHVCVILCVCVVGMHVCCALCVLWVCMCMCCLIAGPHVVAVSLDHLLNLM